MTTTEILQFAQRKKHVKTDSFIVKYHLVLTFASCIAFSLILMREQITGALDCSKKKSDVSQKELNNHCIDGRIFHTDRPPNYLNTSDFEKSPDFG